MAKMVERECQKCKMPFYARLVDVNRGWAKFCSKSCKASVQEQKTHQYSNFRNYDDIDYEGGEWDAHKF
jgi:hypothetical protein